MRKLILAALTATMLVPAAVSAQSWGEVRRGEREVRESRRDLDRAQRYGDRRDVRDARRELREDRRELRDDRRDFRRAQRGGRYYGPRGYNYRPVTPGYRFAPAYYGQRYWVNDWQRYRLARPYGAQRWVRYGNDVVLVDTRSGRVLQAYDGFYY